jgi:hypothetical protein
MSLLGLPDFQRPLHGFKYQIYYPFENSGSFVVASSLLEIGSTKSGRPDFLLEMVRGVSPAMPPKPYAVLDFRIRAVHPAEDALALVRREHPDATVAPPVFRGGFLRLHPAASTGEMPDALIHLGFDGSGLSPAAYAAGSAGEYEGSKGDGGATALGRNGDGGCGPRVPVGNFDPADLLNALAGAAANPSARC